jgi:hypothetical protein
MKQVEITDPFELQNLLDDFGPLRPRLNIYGRDRLVHADDEELKKWRESDVRIHRATAKPAAEPK